jgi:hypothetical protein
MGRIDGVEGKDSDDRQSTIERIRQHQETLAQADAAAALQAAQLAKDAQGAQNSAGNADQQSAARVDDVAVAHSQANRAESWREYASTEKTELPKSISDLAQATRDQTLKDDEKKEDATRQITAAELQFQLAQQGRGIRG